MIKSEHKNAKKAKTKAENEGLREDVSKIELWGNTFWEKTKPIIFIAVPAMAAFTGLLIIFSISHFTQARYKLDPLARAAEFTRVTFANTDVEKANAHLAIAEARLRDFTALREKSPNSQYLGRIAAAMVVHDKQAMRYMDKAKRGGNDIKKLKLVERLCDSLGLQNKELAQANPDLDKLHTFAESLEDKVDAGQTIESAMTEVELDLNAAMQW